MENETNPRCKAAFPVGKVGAGVSLYLLALPFIAASRAKPRYGEAERGSADVGMTFPETVSSSHAHSHCGRTEVHH